jgi:hypothetical protein
MKEWQKIDFKKGVEKGHTFIVMKARAASAVLVIGVTKQVEMKWLLSR